MKRMPIPFNRIFFFPLLLLIVLIISSCGGGTVTVGDSKTEIQTLLDEAAAALSIGDVVTARDKYDGAYRKVLEINSEGKISSLHKTLHSSNKALSEAETAFVSYALNQSSFGLVLTRTLLLPEHASLVGIMDGFGQSPLLSGTKVFGADGFFQKAKNETVGITDLAVTIGG